MQSVKWIELLLIVSGLMMFVNSKAIIPVDINVVENPDESTMEDREIGALRKTPIHFINETFVRAISDKDLVEKSMEKSTENFNRTGYVMMLIITILSLFIAVVAFLIWYTRKNRFPHPYAWCCDQLAMLFGHNVQA